MLETDTIIFLQMQKTGSTHAAKVLAEYLGVPPKYPEVGKHQPATQEQIESGKPILSAIRNPWDWYVSLWTFGVAGKGGLHSRLTASHRKSEHERLASSHESPAISAHAWSALYQDKTCVTSFRRWLQCILDPRNAMQLGEGYAASGLAKPCGFMTYRYLRLCCGVGQQRASGVRSEDLRTPRQLLDYDNKHCYVSRFLRQEKLNQDLHEIISSLRKLSAEESNQILRLDRTNPSQRPLSIKAYYDTDSIDMIRQREQLLIHKFRYTAPTEASNPSDAKP
jgi:hypothetical protein